MPTSTALPPKGRRLHTASQETLSLRRKGPTQREGNSDAPEDDTLAPMFYGRACPYNSNSDLLYGRFIERFLPGAFDESLARTDVDVIATWNHNPQLLLGRRKSGTLRLTSKDDGLYAECDRNDTSYANDLALLIASGDVTGMSFMFEPIEETYERGDTVDIVTVKRAHLYEVCFTYNPAYPASEGNVRQRELETATVTAERDDLRAALASAQKREIAATLAGISAMLKLR